MAIEGLLYETHITEDACFTVPVMQKAIAESRAAALYGDIGARVMEMTLYI